MTVLFFYISVLVFKMAATGRHMRAVSRKAMGDPALTKSKACTKFGRIRIKLWPEPSGQEISTAADVQCIRDSSSGDTIKSVIICFCVHIMVILGPPWVIWRPLARASNEPCRASKHRVGPQITITHTKNILFILCHPGFHIYIYICHMVCVFNFPNKQIQTQIIRGQSQGHYYKAFITISIYIYTIHIVAQTMFILVHLLSHYCSRPIYFLCFLYFLVLTHNYPTKIDNSDQTALNLIGQVMILTFPTYKKTDFVSPKYRET